ncbi:MAG: hypothetical protein QOK15_2195 [Nocardioidaceae bacterium]|nr:hypothetical protein [Nocardioidaceae bacterium]
MHRTYPAEGPQQLFVEIGSGEVSVTTADVDTVEIEVSGRNAEEVQIEQHRSQVDVIAPRGVGFRTGSSSLTVTITAPSGSDLVTKLGSAGIVGRGVFGAVRVTTGSGSVDLDEVVEPSSVKTGSGTIVVRRLHAECDLKTGSGEITVGRSDETARLSSGSGDIEVGQAHGAVSLKSGSGDLVVGTAGSDALLSSGSGDLRIGRMSRGQAQLKNASGDIRLGIPAGTPVWTDITSTTGRVRSTLTPTGAPAEGQDFVEVRAKTVTGDVYLEQL